MTPALLPLSSQRGSHPTPSHTPPPRACPAAPAASAPYSPPSPPPSAEGWRVSGPAIGAASNSTHIYPLVTAQWLAAPILLPARCHQLHTSDQLASYVISSIYSCLVPHFLSNIVINFGFPPFHHSWYPIVIGDSGPWPEPVLPVSIPCICCILSGEAVSPD